MAILDSKEKTKYNPEVERKNNVIGKKLTVLRKEKKLTLAAFSKLLAERGISISVAGINKWENGGAINAYQLLTICDILGVDDIMAFFSSTGSIGVLNEEGLHRLNQYRDDLIATGKYTVKAEETPAPQMREMPYITLKVSAGTGTILDSENVEMRLFPVEIIPKGADFAVSVSGDSMEPIYYDGDLVWVQKCTSLRIGEVGVFNYDGEGYIKAYSEKTPAQDIEEQYVDSDGVLHMQPVLVSYNDRYSPREVSPSLCFQVVGRVL